MPTLVVDILRLTAWLMLLGLVFAPLEWLFELHERAGRRRAILVDLGYYYLNGILPALLLVLPLAAVSAIVRAALPATYVETIAALPLWAAIPVGLIIAEFGSYFAHRWCHRSPYLWQFHAIHHSPEHLDWLVNTRAHPVDIIITRLGGLIPLYLLGLDKVGGHGVTPAIITLIGTLLSFFAHANVRWRFGLLEHVIVTPMFHHWHHTNDEHRDRNFAATLPIVDRLFGTLHLPNQWPTIYGIDHPIAGTLREELALPFLPPRPPVAQTGTEPKRADLGNLG